MRTLKIVCAIAVVAGAVAVSAPQAEARPDYVKGFVAKYEGLKEAVDEKKCGVCHGDEGKKKNVLSDYAKALKEALGEKNVKDEEKIAKALSTVEGQKCGDDDKTWGDILKKGLPPAAP